MIKELIELRVIVHSSYHRDQFDDWLAGGEIEFRGKRYYWIAQDSNYGFGWEIEPITDKEWRDVLDDEFNKIIKLIEKCLCEHKTEYAFEKLS